MRTQKLEELIIVTKKEIHVKKRENKAASRSKFREYKFWSGKFVKGWTVYQMVGLKIIPG